MTKPHVIIFVILCVGTCLCSCHGIGTMECRCRTSPVSLSPQHVWQLYSARWLLPGPVSAPLQSWANRDSWALSRRLMSWYPCNVALWQISVCCEERCRGTHSSVPVRPGPHRIAVQPWVLVSGTGWVGQEGNQGSSRDPPPALFSLCPRLFWGHSHSPPPSPTPVCWQEHSV